MQTSELRKFLFGKVSCCLLLAACCSLSEAKSHVETVTDLPPPFNLQATVLNRTVTLNWQWQPPDLSPKFSHLSYEVLRDSAPVKSVDKTSFTELDVAIGSHTYRVRTQGESKENGKTVLHISDWSEPAAVLISLACSQPPAITLRVDPIKPPSGEAFSLRLHFVGDVKVPAGCNVGAVLYHIDTGTGTPLSGDLKLDQHNHFDQFAQALGSEDESFSGRALINVTVTAADELGTTTSNVFTLDIQPQNPYAPTTAY